MIIVTIILLVALGLLSFLLWTPIYLEADSPGRLLQIRIRGIGSARLVVSESRIGIGLNILGWEKNVFPGKGTKPKKKGGVTLKRSTLKKMPRKILSVLRSFQVQNLYLNIDTDDYATNALLYPIGVLLSRPNRQMSINFLGEVELRLQIQNNLQRMLRAYLFTN
ncbi:MAG: hypothetical protein ACHQM6_01205 [Candidatus Kapaibacterium sp.]